MGTAGPSGRASKAAPKANFTGRQRHPPPDVENPIAGGKGLGGRYASIACTLRDLLIGGHGCRSGNGGLRVCQQSGAAWILPGYTFRPAGYNAVRVPGQRVWLVNGGQQRDSGECGGSHGNAFDRRYVGQRPVQLACMVWDIVECSAGSALV